MIISSEEVPEPSPALQAASPLWRDILTGAAGFILGGIALLLVLLLGSRLLPFKWLAGFLPQEQVLQKLLFGIFLFFLLLVLGGVAQGVVVGLTLHRIDRLATQRRYILAGGVTFGLLQALLLILFILVLALVFVFNNNADVSSKGLAFLFGVYGLIYGLLIGLLLGVTSVGWRHFWRVLLAAVVGYLLGGVATGYLLWFSGRLTDQGYRFAGLLFVLGAAVALHFFGGGLLGWEYHRLARKRQEDGALPAQVSLVWRWIGIAAGVVILVGALALATRLMRFVQIKPGSLSTMLPSKTEGVSWQDAVQVPGALPDPGSPPILATASDGQVAIAWVQGSAAQREVYLAFAPVEFHWRPGELDCTAKCLRLSYERLPQPAARQQWRRRLGCGLDGSCPIRHPTYCVLQPLQPGCLLTARSHLGYNRPAVRRKCHAAGRHHRPACHSCRQRWRHPGRLARWQGHPALHYLAIRRDTSLVPYWLYPQSRHAGWA